MAYVLKCFPHDDEAFAADAARGMDRFDGHIPHDRDGLPETLADFLRDTYPMVTVHRSHELATVMPSERTLYAYRDGRPVPK